MPCIIPAFLNHWSFLQIVGVCGHHERGGGVALWSAPRAGRLGGLVLARLAL